MLEIWKDIPGYEGLYQVSNLGNVKSLERYKDYKTHLVLNKEKLLKFNNSNGYSKVTLYKNNERKHILVHRLVASAFIVNTENKKEVNHIDGNKLNNNLQNLEWCTRSENQIHANINGLQGIRIRKNNYRIQVSKYDININFICSYNSIKEASIETKICESSIRKVLYGKIKTAGGFIWKK